MKGLGFIATCFLIIAAAGAVTTALQLGLVVLVVYGVLFRTRETCGMLLSLALISFIGRFPWAFAITFALAIIVRLIAGKPNKPHNAE